MQFQCPEGRYSSALRMKSSSMFWNFWSFSAPKGVIAVRYHMLFQPPPYKHTFQCPEGRYSSALPQRVGGNYVSVHVSVPRRAL